MGCPLSDSPTIRCLQAFWAVWTCELPTAPSALMAAALGIPPLPAGSGKSGTPCERMQEEYASSLELPLAEAPPPAVDDPVAPPGVVGPLPHAATATPTARIAADSKAARSNRRRHLGSGLAFRGGECIRPPGSPSVTAGSGQPGV